MEAIPFPPTGGHGDTTQAKANCLLGRNGDLASNSFDSVPRRLRSMIYRRFVGDLSAIAQASFLLAILLMT